MNNPGQPWAPSPQNDFNCSHPGIRTLGRIQLGPLPQGLSEGRSQCWLRLQPHLQAQQGKSMLPSLLCGCWQDSGLYRVWQITTHSSFLAKRSSHLRVTTQKELARSQQDTVRTWHELVSEMVSTTLAVFCWWASGHCSTYIQQTEVTQGHVHQGQGSLGVMLDNVYKSFLIIYCL